MNTRLVHRMKHSNITYNAITKMTLIDNSLIKDLEIAQKRKLKLEKIKHAETQIAIEMSESHATKPLVKTTPCITSR